jgi:hypothetical protein
MAQNPRRGHGSFRVVEPMMMMVKTHGQKEEVISVRTAEDGTS